MNRVRKKYSDSDRSRVESEKEMAKKKTGATLAGKDADSDRLSKKVGNGGSHGSSNRSHSSSIRSHRMNDDENNIPDIDPYVSVRVADTPLSRTSSVKSGHNVSDTDPYSALRIADTPRARRNSGMMETNDPYIPLRVADSLRSTSREVVPSSDSYVSLRIAPSHRFHTSAENVDEVIYDSNDSSGTEEDDAYDSDGSRYEHVDEEELSEFGGDDGSEDMEQEFSGFARVSVVGSETEHGKDEREFAEHGRVSVPGSEAEYGKDLGKDFSIFARVSVAGSQADYRKDGDGEFPGYARVSVAGSEIDYGKDVHAKVPRGGSEVDHAKDVYARVSVAGSEIDYGEDAYARFSVAGSEAELVRDLDRDVSGYARVSVAGREVDHGKDVYARVSVAGSETDSGRDRDREFVGYARVSVAGSENDYGRDKDREFAGYARVSVAGSEVEHGKDYDRDTSRYARLTVPGSKAEDVDDVAGFRVPSLKNKMNELFEQEKDSSVGGPQDKEDEESWDEEYETYMELSPESRAKLQYRVRVVLISPVFELKERKLTAFSDLYTAKFGEDVQATGFSSAERLCRAMPNVVQRKQLEAYGELILVDSSRNRRAVSGIRSGLRRIVYDALKSFGEEITYPQLEERCSELLGKPLVEVLIEHGYDTPTVEGLVKDMPDIAGFAVAGLETRVFLCTMAEDPALSDGLLVKSLGHVTPRTSHIGQSNDELENGQEIAKDSGASGGRFTFHPESLKVGGSSVTLRSLKNELKRFGFLNHASISLIEDEILQVRLRMRILLTFHNSGRGVEVRELPELYTKSFCRNLDLQELGFSSLQDLARHWPDIFLLQEMKPDWVFLLPSQSNRRILNTLRMGLRSSVFSVLVETYPDGLEPLEFLHRLQQVMSGELWEVLDGAGYIGYEAEKADSILSSSSSSDFQLVDFEEVCVLLDDMMDFVRLGSNDDGSVIIKLRNGEVPLIDLLLDCKMEETDVRSFDELFVNLMMIAVDDTQTSDADDGATDNGGFINVGHVQSLVKSFEGGAGLRSAHSQTNNSLTLKHEIRLILGCPEYFENGLAWSELSNVYRDRTGQELGSKAKVKSLLRAMPDVVCKDSLVGDCARLSKTPKNLRILSTTKAGLRQVLFWVLVKNPGGVWANLLQGWFTDFAGISLATTLQIHGYEVSKSKPFFPVCVFLKDMSDLLQKKSTTHEVYTWTGEVKDPIHSDASLLGLSELMIQYDPMRGELEKAQVMGDLSPQATFKGGNREAELVEGLEDKTALKEVKIDSYPELIEELGGKTSMKEVKAIIGAELVEDLEDTTVLKKNEVDREAELVNDIVEKSALKEAEGGVKAGLEDKVDAMKVHGVVTARDEGRHQLHSDAIKVHGVVTSGDEGSHQLHSEVEGDREIDGGTTVEGIVKEEDANDEEEYQADSGVEDGSHSGETEESIDNDASYPPQSNDVMGKETEAKRSESTAEAYAQLRVTGKGPKVNLDEWQFTDSEEEEEEEEEEEMSDDDNDFQEEYGSECSETENVTKEQEKTSPPVTYVAPKVKETGKDNSRAWVLPNKGIPWK